MATLRHVTNRTKAWMMAAGIAIVAVICISQCSTPNIHEVVWEGDVNRLQTILEGDASLIHSRGRDGRTPLHVAASYGNQINPERIKKQKAIIELLLKFRPDVEARDASGETPLHLSARYGRYWNAVTLVENGARVDSRDGNGRTPLHFASGMGSTPELSTRLAEYLIEHGADATAVGSLHGMQPLHFAWTPEIVSLLVSHGAGVNALDRDGRTPLFWAAWRGNVEVVRGLLANGAEAGIADSEGTTPLHRATQAEIVAALLESGAAAKATDNHQRTPLHVPGSLKRARLLLSHGAEINAKDENGWTPLDHALQALADAQHTELADEIQRTVDDLRQQGATRGR